MTSTASINVEYGSDSNNSCSGILFEVPNTEIVGGDSVEIRLWGGSFPILAPYYLVQGTDSMGIGSQVLLPSGSFSENISFADSPTARTTWPMSSLTSAITTAVIPGIAAAGEDIKDLMIANNDVLTMKDNVSLTTILDVTYNVSQEVEVNIDFAETFQFQAEWPIAEILTIEALNEIVIINPTTGALETWATKGELITNKFMVLGGSCVKEIDSTKLYGSVKLRYNRVQYYKKWYWEVPVGQEGLYWFFIYKDGIVQNKFSIELPDLTEGIPEPRNIALTVYARASEALIVGAFVYIDEMYVGTTDKNGVLYVDGIMQGKHALRVSKIGFIDTDKDELYNDEFMVY